jgi:hypothetical protein
MDDSLCARDTRAIRARYARDTRAIAGDEMRQDSL